MSATDEADKAFIAHRAKLQAELDDIEQQARHKSGSVDRRDFYEAVYARAGADAANVPWADQKPKLHLDQWLNDNPGHGRTALDIACGLGDNAAAMAEAGYTTTGFDISPTAIEWARQRFPIGVTLEVADLLAPPSGWLGAFDLVHECYTIQSVEPSLHADFAKAIAAFVKPGGILLVYARSRGENDPAVGPPWPLKPSERDVFAELGFRRASQDLFDIARPDRTIAHEFSVWQKEA